jgi:pimeloyl-ACP methyl ester carboxylesterase
MTHIELSAGTIEYEDSGGDGPTFLLLHGLPMDASLWDDVIAGLSVDHRCVAPTLPLGAAAQGNASDADRSLRGIARFVGELRQRLDPHDVTLAGNGTGGALAQLLVCDGAARVSQIVLASCDAFNNLPRGLNAEFDGNDIFGDDDLDFYEIPRGDRVHNGSPFGGHRGRP